MLVLVWNEEGERKDRQKRENEILNYGYIFWTLSFMHNMIKRRMGIVASPIIM